MPALLFAPAQRIGLLARGGFCLSFLAAQTSGLQSLPDGARQVAQPVFKQDIRGPHLQTCHSFFSAERAAEDDERDVELPLVQQPEGAGRVEPGQMVIGQHNIRRPAQPGQVLRFRLCPFPIRFEPTPPQFQGGQLGLAGAIFKDQNTHQIPQTTRN